MKDFKIPELGENISSATIVKILVQVGETIEIDQSVLELETDKATIEVPSDINGKVVSIQVSEGDSVKIGQVILTLEEAGVEVIAEEEATPVAESQSAAFVETVQAPPAQTLSAALIFTLPELGENISKATIIKLLINVGDEIEEDQSVLELETDKATIEVPSSVVGKVSEIMVKEGDVLNIGTPIFKVAESTAAILISAPTPVKAEAPIQTAVENSPKFVAEKVAIADVPKAILVENQPPILQNAAPAAPSVRRLAREIGVDVNQIKGSGLGGRILLDDVKAFSKTLHQQRNETQHIRTEQHQQPLPDFSKFGTVERQAMSNIRYKTAEHLSNAWHTIPHVTQFDKADITALEAFRKSYTKTADKQGVKLTVTAILVKIIAAALKKFPQFNSSVDMLTKEVVYKSYFNIGIAVDTEFGLIVPVIKNADQLTVIEISREMNALAEKARNKKASIADMQGGCITITNLGGIGGTAFTPIINAPEVAILGVSRGSIEPVFIDGKFEPRTMLPFSLSYDHRVIDGADGIRFLRWVIEAIENPMKFIVEG
jgi:pyruvate dehydrogenase E2 component (dihydrolipoamide acetyltransferase)